MNQENDSTRVLKSAPMMGRFAALGLRGAGALMVAMACILTAMAFSASSEVIDRSGPGNPSNLQMVHPAEVWSLVGWAAIVLAASAIPFGLASILDTLARLELRSRT